MSITAVEDGLDIRFSSELDVVQDMSDLVRGRGDGLGGSELGVHTPEQWNFPARADRIRKCECTCFSFVD